MNEKTEQDDSLSADEIKALLWATAPYSPTTYSPTTLEIHESSVVGHSVALIRSARAKLERWRS